MSPSSEALSGDANGETTPLRHAVLRSQGFLCLMKNNFIFALDASVAGQKINKCDEARLSQAVLRRAVWG